jgi:hypothetical protein
MGRLVPAAATSASSAARVGDEERHRDRDGNQHDERDEKPAMLTEVLHEPHLLSLSGLLCM